MPVRPSAENEPSPVWEIGSRFRRRRTARRELASADRLLVVVLQRVLLHAVAEAPERDAEQLRRVRADAARALERLQDETPLDLAEHVVERATLLRQDDERGRRLRCRAAHLGRQVAE